MPTLASRGGGWTIAGQLYSHSGTGCPSTTMYRAVGSRTPQAELTPATLFRPIDRHAEGQPVNGNSSHHFQERRHRHFDPLPRRYPLEEI